MKITTFNPMILSPNAEEVVKLFEELGFKRKHAPTIDLGTSEVTSVRMEDVSGFNVDVADVKSLPQDMTIIRMNVDDFDEAYAMLMAKGFHHSGSGKVVETASNKSALLLSPSGFAFDLCQHIKNHD